MGTDKKPDNIQAFPQTWEQNGTTDNWENGMTLRDYFAAKAISGILSSQTEMRANGMDNASFGMQIETIVEESFLIADAMLKQREK